MFRPTLIVAVYVAIFMALLVMAAGPNTGLAQAGMLIVAVHGLLWLVYSIEASIRRPARDPDESTPRDPDESTPRRPASSVYRGSHLRGTHTHEL